MTLTRLPIYLGATGVGKSKLVLEIDGFGGEIICADARQINVQRP